MEEEQPAPYTDSEWYKLAKQAAEDCWIALDDLPYDPDDADIRR